MVNTSNTSQDKFHFLECPLCFEITKKTYDWKDQNMIKKD